jgi:phosphinothricin acetyltransferase
MLLAELCLAAEKSGVRKLIAVIGDSANEKSIGLHQAVGFQHAGRIANCGWKFDRWLDIVMMEKTLGHGATLSPE